MLGESIVTLAEKVGIGEDNDEASAVREIKEKRKRVVIEVIPDKYTNSAKDVKPVDDDGTTFIEYVGSTSNGFDEKNEK